MWIKTMGFICDSRAKDLRVARTPVEDKPGAK